MEMIEYFEITFRKCKLYQYRPCGDDTVSKEYFDILRELRIMNCIIVGHVGVTARHSNRFRVSVNTSPHRFEEKIGRRRLVKFKVIEAKTMVVLVQLAMMLLINFCSAL